MVMERTRSRAHLLLKLARPHFLVPGFLLFLLGFLLGAVRGGAADIGRFFFGYSIFWAAHLSVSFSNDYFDREGDRMGKPNSFSGGSGILVSHRELERLALVMAVGLLFASTALAGLFTILNSFPPIFFAYSVGGALLGWFYSAPPLRLSSKGLSEITTSFAAGFIMPGMGHYVSFGSVDTWFLTLSVPLLCYGAYFILTVEMPDVEADRLAKKKNFLTEKGRRAGTMASVFTMATGSVSLTAIAVSGLLGFSDIFKMFAFCSLIPLSGALSALPNRLLTEGDIMKQVKINFASLMVFVLLADAVLLVSLA
jgi:1,4-dihydroxy-2-naphthoate octaprenyltransferase